VTPAWVETKPLVLKDPTPETMHQRWHLKDSDERAIAYVAGRAPPRWDLPSELQGVGALDYVPVPLKTPRPPSATDAASPETLAAAAKERRAHPLYRSSTLMLLSEIVNARLFSTVRDALGLTYDVSFEINQFDRLPHAWYVVSVTSEPPKIDDALTACVRVLRGLKNSLVTPRELERAKRTIMVRHESDLKDNGYWLGLMTHLQSDAVPLKSIYCLRDFMAMFEAIQLEDVYEAYNLFNFNDGAMFTAIGTSGKNEYLPPKPMQLTEDDKAAALRAMQEFLKSGGFAKAFGGGNEQ
jgi:hypothetical protein